VYQIYANPEDAKAAGPKGKVLKNDEDVERVRR